MLRRRELLLAGPAALAWPRLALAAPGALHDIAAARGIAFGSYIYADLLDKDPEHGALAAREAALIVASVFHWSHVAPTPERTDFAAVDAVLAWTAARELKLRGHTLLWGEALPKWFGALPDRAAAVRAVEAHIARMCRHLAGRLHSWDVVNEAIKVNDGRADRLRRTELIDKIGADFLDIAFRAARAGDRKAKLVYNDFDLELDVPEQREKRRVLLDMIDGFKKRGTPIDAVGLQSHLSLEDMPRFNERAFGDFLREVAARGVEIMITELDVVDRAAPADIAKRDAQVAAAYRRFLDVALAEPAVKTLVVWGLGDRNSWIDWINPRTRRADKLHPRPLLFDEDYRPKPAYLAVAEALHAAPRR